MKRITTKTIDMLRKMTFALTLSVCIMGLYAQSLKADQSINPEARSLLSWNYDGAKPVADREHTIDVGAAANGGEPRKTMRAKTRSPEKEGFFAPTLDGPWRFTLAGWGWLPDIPVKIKLDHREVDLPIDLGKIIDSLQFAAMADFEVRKGSLGVYATPIVMLLEDSEDVQGPLQTHRVIIDDDALLVDFGVSYEVGRWHLGKKPDSPAVTVEPFLGARWLVDDISVKIRPGGPLRPGGRTFTPEINFIAPVAGIRTFWDVTEHWNFRAEGDYGGFDVDHLKETWNVLGIVGYRFRSKKSENLSINLFAGYRYLYARYKKVAELEVAVKGPLIGIALEF